MAGFMLFTVVLMVGSVLGLFYYFGSPIGDRSKVALVPAGVLGAVAAIAVVSSLFTGDGSSVDDRPVMASTTTITVRSTTTSTTPTTTTIDPHMGRPVYDEFLLLSTFDPDMGSICRDRYESDFAACYDGFQRGTPDFEAVVVNNLETFVATSPGYSSDQYGCHSDGRCLDDYGTWCDEADVGYVEGEYGDSALVCYPLSYDQEIPDSYYEP